MTTTVSGSYPAVNSDSDVTINGLTVGKGGGSIATNTSLGASALNANTTGTNNTAIGMQSLNLNTTTSNNTAVGYQAGYSNTTGITNTFLGAQAGLSVTTGSYNIAIGASSGGVLTTSTGTGNLSVGSSAGASLTTGSYNTFVGAAGQISQGPGGLITTGSKNTILGGYNGNQGSLDIRTASNYIVLSDGDGNPRQYTNGGNAVTNGNRTSIALTGGVAANLIPYSYLFPNDSTLTSAIIQIALNAGNGIDGACSGYYTLHLMKAFSTYTVTVINSGLPQNNSGYGFTFALNASFLTVTPAKTCTLHYVSSTLTGVFLA
jgi:hypothetical protein